MDKKADSKLISLHQTAIFWTVVGVLLAGILVPLFGYYAGLAGRILIGALSYSVAGMFSIFALSGGNNSLSGGAFVILVALLTIAGFIAGIVMIAGGTPLVWWNWLAAEAATLMLASFACYWLSKNWLGMK